MSARNLARLVLAASLIAPGVARVARARADEEPYVHEGFVWRSTTAARYNPLGLSTFLRFGYRHPLLGPQDDRVLQSTFVGVNAVGGVTPAYARGGIRLDVQPLAILQLLASYEAVGVFGTFGALQSFPDVSAEFSDAAQARRAKAGLSYATTGRIATLNPILQARVGKWTLVVSTELIHTEMNVHPGDTVYYDLPYAMLAPGDGWLLGNEADLTFALGPHLGLGVHHGLYHALFAHGEANAARVKEITPIECLGPILTYELSRTNGPARLKNPAVFLISSWWLRNPYRTGAEVPRAVPYVIVGVTFEGDVVRASGKG
jgi:hypothetical protein